MQGDKKQARSNLNFLLAILIVFGISFLFFKFIYKAEVVNDNVQEFSSCSILENNCINNSCKLFYLCNDQEVNRCRIYDCANVYGIEAVSKDGITLRSYKEKPDNKKAESDVEKCDGKLSITESKCIEEKMEIKVYLTSSGVCKVSGFTMKIDDQDKMGFFVKENEYYLVTANKCGKVSNLAAIGEGGVQITE